MPHRFYSWDNHSARFPWWKLKQIKQAIRDKKGYKKQQIFLCIFLPKHSILQEKDTSEKMGLFLSHFIS